MTFREAAHLSCSLQWCQGAEDFRDGLAFMINIPHFAAIANWLVNKCFLIYFYFIWTCFKTSVHSFSSTFLWLDLEGNSFRREIQALTSPETLLLFPGRIQKTPPGGFWIGPDHSTLFILLSYPFFFFVIQLSTPKFHWKYDLI